MIHLPSHSLSGNQSAARNGGSNTVYWGEIPMMFIDHKQPDVLFIFNFGGIWMRNQVERLRREYPAGTKVELQSMAGETQMPSGLTGVVKFVDDIGSIHVSWENGSSLALIPGEDEFQVIQEQQPVMKLE